MSIEKKQLRIKRLKKLKTDSELAIFDHVNDLEDKVDEAITTIEKSVEEVKDRTANDFEVVTKMTQNLLKDMKGPAGEKGENGKDGEMGSAGPAGKDGLAGMDGREGSQGPMGPAGRDGKTGPQGPAGMDGNDGSPDTAEQIIKKINTTEQQIDPKAIRGFNDLERIARANSNAVPVTTTHFYQNGSFVGRAKNINIIPGSNVTVGMTQTGDQENITINSTSSGGAVSVTDGVTTVANITQVDFVSGATVSNGGGGVAQVSISGGGSSGFQRPLSGSLNQGTFTWATAPNSITVDNLTLQKTSTNGQVNWTGTTTTALTVFPTQDVFSLG